MNKLLLIVGFSCAYIGGALLGNALTAHSVSKKVEGSLKDIEDLLHTIVEDEKSKRVSETVTTVH